LKIRAGYDIAFNCVQEVPILLLLSVHPSRQRDLLNRASDSLRRSLGLVEEGEELAAEELRAAAYALGRLLGRVDVEDVLGTIFQKFCIGK